MDGEPVEGEPSENIDPISLTEFFIRMFPHYKMMGMTYEEYWNGPAWLARACREAWNQQEHYKEWERWRQGMYFYDALLKAAPVMRTALSNTKVEPGKYPDEPYPLTEKEAKEREEAREKANYEAYIARMEAASNREMKRRAEEAAREAKDNGRH